MGSQNSVQTTESKSMIKEMGRLRANGLFMVFLAVYLIGVIMEEADIPIRAADDMAGVGLSIVGLVFIGLTWKRRSVENLRMANNTLFVLILLMLAFTIFGASQEAGNFQDFSDEIPSIILLVLGLTNRFI